MKTRLFSIALVLAVISPVFGQVTTNYIWSGPEGGDWYDANNWSNGATETIATEYPPFSSNTAIYVGYEAAAIVSTYNNSVVVSDENIADRPALYIGYNNAGYSAVFTNDFNNNTDNRRYQSLDIGAGGDGSSGELIIEQGQVIVQGGGTRVGDSADSTGIIRVNGNNGLNMASDTYVGNGVGSYGLIEVNNGGRLSQNGNAQDTQIGSAAFATGIVTVAAGARLDMDHANGDLRIAQVADSYGKLYVDAAADLSLTDNDDIFRDEIRVGNGARSTGILDAVNASLRVDNGFYFGNGVDSKATVIASNLVFTGNADLRIGEGNGSATTLTLQDSNISIASGQTNAIFIGLGSDSTIDFSNGDLNFVDNGGMLAGFGVGKAGSNYVDLINRFDSSGYLTANIAMAITNKEHKITNLSIGDTANATGELTIAGAAVITDNTIGTLGLDMTLGTGGDNSSGSFTSTSNYTILGNNLYVATGGENAYGKLDLVNGNITNDAATTIANKLNSTGIVNVASYTAIGFGADVNIADGENAYGSLTAADGQVQTDDLRVGDATGAYGVLDMGSGAIRLDNQTWIGAGGAGSTGIVHASTFTNRAAGKSMAIGTAAGSYGELMLSTVSMTNMANINVGTATGSGGKLVVSTGGVMTNNGTANIATGAGATALVDADMWVMTNANLNLATGDGSYGVLTNKQFDGSANIVIASGNNSTGIWNLAGSTAVVLNQNSVSIGAGVGSKAIHNAVFSGVLGDFTVGEGSSAADKDLIQQLDSVGFITANANLVVTNMSHSHDVTALNVAQADNSIAAVLINTNLLNSATTITIADGANSTGSMNTESGYLTLQTNSLRLAMGYHSTMASDVIFEGVAGDFRIGYGADDSTKDAINHIETIGEISLNTRGLQITSGVHTISNLRLSDTVENNAFYTNDATAQDLVITNNFLIGDAARGTGTFVMVSGSLNVENTLVVGNADGGQGRFIMEGGVVTTKSFQVGSGGISAGDQGTGRMVVTGGTFTVTAGGVVGGENNQHNRKGTLIIGGGATVEVGTALNVGGNNYNTAKLEGSEGTIIVSNGTLTANNMNVGRTYTSTGTVHLADANAYVATTSGSADFIVGQASNALGTVIVDAGTLSAGRHMLLGDNMATSKGKLMINGGAVIIGAVNTAGNLNLGDNAGSTGIVEMTGGTLNVANNIIVGQTAGTATEAGGYGSFTATGAAITNGGGLLVANNNYTKGFFGVTNSNLRTLGTIVTADALGSDGEAYIIGSTFISTNSPAALNIGTGTDSKGLLKIVGGDGHIQASTVYAGTASGSEGTLILGNMGITNTDFLSVGQNGGVGTVTLTNGTFFSMQGVAGKHARIGLNAGSTGTLNLDGGTLDMTVGGNDLYVGQNASATGTVNMTAGAIVTDQMLLGVGTDALGTFNASDGTLTANQLVVGNSTGGEGVANIYAGAVVNVDEIEVGNNSSGAKGMLNIEGGTVNVGTDDGGNGYFTLGNPDNTTAEVNQSGGTVNMIDTTAGNLRIGLGGAGTYNLTGGTLNATNLNTNIGQFSNGNGTLNVSGTGIFDGGGLAVAVGASSSSTGSVNIYDGGQLKANNLNVGNSSGGGVGYLTAAGGTITLNNALNVGASGMGEATLKDNAVVNTEILQVGVTAGSEGGTLYIQDNAVVNVGTTDAGNGHFRIGNASNTTAVVNMTGGTLNMIDTTDIGNLQLGYQGAGTVNLSGGQINATNQTVQIGVSNGGDGTLNVSGNGVFNAGPKAITVGNSSNSVGNVNVNGGQLVAGTVHVGFNADGVGYFTVTGGVVNIATAMNVGTAGTGALTMKGGELNVGDLAIGGGVTGTVSLLDGVLNITQENTLTINSGGLLVIEGGTLNWNTGTKTDGEIFTIFDDFVTSGQITWSNTVAAVPDTYDYSWANGDGSTLFLNIDGGTSTLVAAIPEPTTALLTILFGGGLLAMRRRLRK